MAARRATALLLAAMLATATTARAHEEARVVAAEPARAGDQLVCTLVLDRLFTPPIESTLKSGLPVVIDMALELLPEGGGRALGRLLRTEARYDVWDDFYTLRRDGCDRRFADFAGLERACRRVDAWPLAGLGDLPAPVFGLRVRVAVSPLSGEERERMVRWVAETVSDPGDPAARELRLDLGGLIEAFFKGGGRDRGWGPEARFGPFRAAALPVAPPAGRPENGLPVADPPADAAPAPSGEGGGANEEEP
ncbi:MAG: hypothetical protein JXB04_08405 [Kiritimatiellae bacterium]|nr:hypothetical protein [Kiritimatiellia bacterium]